MSATTTETIAKLTKRGRELMTAVGKGQFSFFDDGIVENSGIWGSIMAGEFFSSPRSASGVMNATAKLGLWTVSEQDGSDGPDAGAWWALTTLGAEVANALAAEAALQPEEPVQADSPAEAEVGPEKAVERPEMTPDATYPAQGNYNTVWVPMAEAMSGRGSVVWTEKASTMLVNVHIAGVEAEALAELLRETETAAVAALREWQKTQDRKGQTDMEKYNQNRSFLAGYGAAVAKRYSGAKSAPEIAFAKDMEKALRPEARKAGAAAAKAAK